MNSIISNASSTFNTAMGFGTHSVVDYMKSLLLLVMGNAFGVLLLLVPYLLAILAIVTIVRMVWAAFHLEELDEDY